MIIMYKKLYIYQKKILHTFFRLGMIPDNAIKSWLSFSLRFLSAITCSEAQVAALVPLTTLLSSPSIARAPKLHSAAWEVPIICCISGLGSSSTALPNDIFFCKGGWKGVAASWTSSVLMLELEFGEVMEVGT